MLPFRNQAKQEPSQARWSIGIDRRRVGTYVALAIIGGFLIGILAARFSRSDGTHGQVIEPEALNTAPGHTITQAATESDSTFHRVTGVLRSDTVDVEGIGPVCMIGIEAPDGKSTQQAYAAHVQQARAFTEKTLVGQEVRIEFDPAFSSTGNRNQSGQMLAYLYTRDGTLINGEIIRQGHAFVQTATPFRLIDSFRALEREAMQSLRGVWGSGGSQTAEAKPSPSPSPSPDSRKKLTPLLPSELDPRTVPGTVPGTVSPSEPMVYVSAEDRMYHKEGCEYLGKKKQLMPLSQARSSGHTACGRCFASTVMKAP